MPQPAMIGWLLVIAAVFIYEVYAIKTNEYDTFSELFWKVSKKHWVVRVILFVILVWMFVHLVFGPCALGIC